MKSPLFGYFQMCWRNRTINSEGLCTAENKKLLVSEEVKEIKEQAQKEVSA